MSQHPAETTPNPPQKEAPSDTPDLSRETSKASPSAKDEAFDDDCGDTAGGGRS